MSTMKFSSSTCEGAGVPTQHAIQYGGRGMDYLLVVIDSLALLKRSIVF